MAIQICHWLCTDGITKVKQETCLARNNFEHDNNNIISPWGDVHHMDGVMEYVIAQKINCKF